MLVVNDMILMLHFFLDFEVCLIFRSNDVEPFTLRLRDQRHAMELFVKTNCVKFA